MHRSEAEQKRDRKVLRNAFVFSAVMHAVVIGGLAHKEKLQELAKDLPRDARKAMQSVEAEQRAKTFLKEFDKELKEGNPLSVNLDEFYFTQEMQAGGVSAGEVETARKEYKAVIDFALDLQTQGEGFNEVMGYVLKAQGEYKKGSSFFTDLENEGKGNCEARAKYIASAVQDLYPDFVTAGEMKIENFGAYTDDKGVLQPGHVRVILDKDRRIAVLEGDAVRWESADTHADIPAYEATQMAVKAFAADQGVYDFQTDSLVVEESKKGKGAKIEPGSKAVSDSNGINRFPPSKAKYKSDDVGVRDIQPGLVHGSWAPSRLEWENAIELKLIKEKKLTMENFEDVFQLDPNQHDELDAMVELSKYTEIDPEALRAVAEKVKGINYILQVRDDQKLPAELFGDKPRRVIVQGEKFDPENLKGIPISELGVDVKEYIPHLEKLEWQEGASLYLRLEEDSKILLDTYSLSWINEAGVKNVYFTGLGDGAQLLFFTTAFNGVELDYIDFTNVRLWHIFPTEQKIADVMEAYEISEKTPIGRDTLSEANVRKLILRFAGEIHLDALIAPSVSNDAHQINFQGTELNLQGFRTKEGMFQGMKSDIPVLSVNAQELAANTFTDLKADVLVLENFERMKILERTDGFRSAEEDSPLAGADVGRIVIPFTHGGNLNKAYKSWVKPGYLSDEMDKKITHIRSEVIVEIGKDFSEYTEADWERAELRSLYLGVETERTEKAWKIKIAVLDQRIVDLLRAIKRLPPDIQELLKPAVTIRLETERNFLNVGEVSEDRINQLEARIDSAQSKIHRYIDPETYARVFKDYTKVREIYERVNELEQSLPEEMRNREENRILRDVIGDIGEQLTNLDDRPSDPEYLQNVLLSREKRLNAMKNESARQWPAVGEIEEPDETFRVYLNKDEQGNISGGEAKESDGP